MAPKRSGKKKGGRTVLRSTRKVVKETLQVAVVEGDSQELFSSQEENQTETVEAEGIAEDVPPKETLVRTIPMTEKTQKDQRSHEEEEQAQTVLEAPAMEEEPSNEQQEEPVRAEETKMEKKSEPLKEEEAEKAKSEEGKEKAGNKEGTQEGGRRQKKRKRRGMGAEDTGEGYKRYVFRVLKQVHPELRISAMAMSVINSLMKDMFERIADEAAKLSQHGHRTTLSSREIQGAVKLVLPGELGKHALADSLRGPRL